MSVATTTTASNGGSVSDLELAGVKLAERGELVEFALRLFRDGFSEFEIRPAVSKLIDSKTWEGYSQLSRFGIVQAAKELWRKSQAAASVSPPEVLEELEVVSLADVEPETVKWLWPGKIPLGKVTAVYGAAGVGKTSWSLDFASRVSAGLDWPESVHGSGAYPRATAGHVVLLNGEDHFGQCVQPRLKGGGANLDHITAIREIAAKQPGGETTQRDFDLGRDLPSLRQRIERLGNVRLVIIDSLEAYCGSIGKHSQRLRQLFVELGKLAADFDLAVVVISTGTKCDLPVKTVWRVDTDVLDPLVRWWVPVRCQCGPLPDGTSFLVRAKDILWDKRSQTFAPERVEGSTAKQERNSQLQAIVRWLQGYLIEGPRSVRDVLKAGAAAGWSLWQVKRAKLALQVMSYKESATRGRWFWEWTNRPVFETKLTGPGQVGVVLQKLVTPVANPSDDPLDWIDRACGLGKYKREGSKESNGGKESTERADGA